LVFQNGDRPQGLKWLKQAADQGEPRALLVYGTALYNGDGVPQDRVLGYAFVSRAAAQGLAPAQDTLAQLDQLMTAADRQKGVALARSIPSGSPVAGTAKSARMAHVKPTISKTATAKLSATKPAAPAAAKPAPIVAATGGWRIQLGAFSQRSTAEALYQRVSGKAALAGRNPYYIASGSITRLQVGPFQSKAAAASACAAIGGACFAVPAK
jgi:cell division septation protein DedD